MVGNFLPAAAAGLLLGAIYGPMCARLALIIVVLGAITFAQGDFLMGGSPWPPVGEAPRCGRRQTRRPAEAGPDPAV